MHQKHESEEYNFKDPHGPNKSADPPPSNGKSGTRSSGGEKTGSANTGSVEMAAMSKTKSGEWTADGAEKTKTGTGTMFGLQDAQGGGGGAAKSESKSMKFKALRTEGQPCQEFGHGAASLLEVRADRGKYLRGEQSVLSAENLAALQGLPCVANAPYQL